MSRISVQIRSTWILTKLNLIKEKVNVTNLSGQLFKAVHIEYFQQFLFFLFGHCIKPCSIGLQLRRFPSAFDIIGGCVRENRAGVERGNSILNVFPTGVILNKFQEIYNLEQSGPGR